MCLKINIVARDCTIGVVVRLAYAHHLTRAQVTLMISMAIPNMLSDL